MLFVLVLCILHGIGAIQNFTVGFLLSKQNTYKTAIEQLVPYAVNSFNTESDSLKLQLRVEKYDEFSLYGLMKATCNLMDSNVVAVISGDGSGSIAAQADLLNPRNIPLLSSVATDPHLIRGVRKKVLLLSPNDGTQAHVILDILHFYIWQEVSIIASDSSYGINGVTNLQQLLLETHSHRGKIHSIIKSISFFHAAANPEDIEIVQQLGNIRRSLSRVVVLNCEARYGKVVLREAHRMNLLTDGYVWIVTDGITGNPEHLKENGRYPSYLEGLIGISHALYTNSDEFRHFKDHFLKENQNLNVHHITPGLAKLYDTVQIIGRTLKSLKDNGEKISFPNATCQNDSWIHGEKLFRGFTEQILNGASGPLSFDSKGNRKIAKYDVVNFVHPGYFNKIGIWESGLQMLYKQNSDVVRFLGQVHRDDAEVPSGLPNSLNGHHLKVGVTYSPPFAFKKTGECVGNNCWEGVCPEIIKDFAAQLNFTYEFMMPDDRKFGSLNKTTETWSGLIGDLLSHRTDLIAIDLSVSYQRKEYIDFTVSFMDSGVSLAIKGESGKSNIFFFLGPFDCSVWISIVGAMFFASVIQNLLNKLSPYGTYGKRIHALQSCKCRRCAEKRALKYYRGVQFKDLTTSDCLLDQAEEQGPETSDMTFYNSLWVIGAGYVGQGGQSLPESPSGRFFLFTWWFFVMMIVCMYTANLTAFMTLDKMGVSIDSAKGLLSQDKYTWGIVDHSFLEYLLEQNVDPEYRMLLQGAEKLSGVAEGIMRLHDGHFAFIDETVGMKYYTKGICDVYRVQTEFQTFDYAFGLPKNSPYLSLWNGLILKKREEAYFSDIWKRYNDAAGSNHCENEIGRNESLQLMTLKGIFYFLGMGLLISTFLIAIEYAVVTASDSSDTKHTTFYSKLMRRLRLKFDDINSEWLNVTTYYCMFTTTLTLSTRIKEGFQLRMSKLLIKLKFNVANVQKAALITMIVLVIGLGIHLMNSPNM